MTPQPPGYQGYQPYPQQQYQPPRTTNGFAIAALILGIIGGALLALIFAITALVQIPRRGQKGKGMAITGLIFSVLWTGVYALLIAGVVFAASKIHDGPKAGECFDLESGRTNSLMTVVSCAQPHDGQMAAVYDLTETSWPGQAKVNQESQATCEQRLRAAYHTLTPLPGSRMYVSVPKELGWTAGIRTVRCGVVSDNGQKLTRSLSTVSADSGQRTWADLRVGDCVNIVDEQVSDSLTVIPCAKPHNGQLLHQFKATGTTWPGREALDKLASQRCTAWAKAYYKGTKPPRNAGLTDATPTVGAWQQGDRTISCFAKATKGTLTHSLLR